jgi:hypothetical protein
MATQFRDVALFMYARDANDNELHRLIIGTNTSGKEQNYLKVL